ncbi:hypothetical protein WDU94_000438, partial [Cyamophila willieti]
MVQNFTLNILRKVRKKTNTKEESVDNFIKKKKKYVNNFPNSVTSLPKSHDWGSETGKISKPFWFLEQATDLRNCVEREVCFYLT